MCQLAAPIVSNRNDSAPLNEPETLKSSLIVVHAPSKTYRLESPPPERPAKRLKTAPKAAVRDTTPTPLPAQTHYSLSLVNLDSPEAEASSPLTLVPAHHSKSTQPPPLNPNKRRQEPEVGEFESYSSPDSLKGKKVAHPNPFRRVPAHVQTPAPLHASKRDPVAELMSKRNAPRRPPSTPRNIPTIESQALSIEQQQQFQLKILTLVHNLLRATKDRCIVCCIYQAPTNQTHHGTWGCSRTLCTKGTPYVHFRHKFSAADLRKIDLCWKCWVPHGAPCNHPSSNDTPCEFNDILKPLLYSIYILTGLRKTILAYIKVPVDAFQTLGDYMFWLPQRDPLTNIPNMFLVVAMYQNLMVKGRGTHPDALGPIMQPTEAKYRG